jgi:hypothetical protein
MNIHVLKWLEGSRQRQRSAQISSVDPYYGRDRIPADRAMPVVGFRFCATDCSPKQ